jgi:hypothetical protein
VRADRLVLGAILALVALGLVTGPGGGRLLPRRPPPILLTVEGTPADAAAVGRIARILQDDLGLPLPVRITARLYEGPRPFEQGLVQHAALPAPRAAELARFAVGAAIPGSLLLVTPAPAVSPSPEWPRLIAHELTHLAQIELAGPEAAPAQWLAEGMAEWVAYETLGRLGLDDLQARHRLARASGIEYVQRTGGLDLDPLATVEGFIAGHQRAGTLRTYRLTLHLAEALVREHGFAALVGYFRAFRVSRDPAVNFTRAFGRPVPAFERAALAGLMAAEPA